ncbi:hypothetical protein LCGC14_1539610 [marine sediment metagenome]|uniref:Uncharacterized protein n=1 Tax=marine sediment metagenome TaxID=412755 RepID=A0A0F9ITJ0_9ZZZZ
MNTEQGYVLEQMGTGMRLRIEKSDGRATLEEGLQQCGKHRDSVAVNKDVARLLSLSNGLTRMERERHNQRKGWLESGFDGDAAEWYALTQ